MTPIPAILVLAFFIWLGWDIYHTPISKHEEGDPRNYDPGNPDDFI